MHTSRESSGIQGCRAAAAAEWYALVCLCAAVAAVPVLDALTNVLLLFSTFLVAIICRYSRRYLAGDPRQKQFSVWLCITGSCVFGLVLAQNLLLFAVAWLCTSLSLHQLLQFYRDRPGALLSARKKFLISRLGDCALGGAVVLTYSVFQTWDFADLRSAAQSMQSGAELPFAVTVTAVLLVLAAMLKSAQFPFHTWLPDTMETPTPVSALMHAGIINAGGILVIRLAPVISLSPVAMTALAVAGGSTAIFGSVVALTQSSVKRCLAFSTIAQTGFMMLECGLGAFHLALLHLVAHSFYKAYAFLSSGTAVSMEARVWGEPPRAWTTVATLLAASLLWVAGPGWFDQPLLGAIFLLALAQMLWSTKNGSQLLTGVALGAVFFMLYCGLEGGAAAIVSPATAAVPAVLSGTILAVFISAALLQSNLSRIARWQLAQSLYVHARNGFYCNTLANRLTVAIWPLQNAGRN